MIKRAARKRRRPRGNSNAPVSLMLRAPTRTKISDAVASVISHSAARATTRENMTYFTTLNPGIDKDSLARSSARFTDEQLSAIASGSWPFSSLPTKGKVISQINIAVIVGSLRRELFNAKLAQAIGKLAPADLTFKHSSIGDLPLYNQDDDAKQAPEVNRLKAKIAVAQGLLFVTPEYNRSVPASSRMPLTMSHDRMGEVRLQAAPGSLAFRSARSGLQLPSSIFAVSWPTSTPLRLASPKHLFRLKKACSSPTAASQPQASNSYNGGSIVTSPG